MSTPATLRKSLASTERCTALRNKPSRYLGTRNVSGMSWQTCGRKAIVISSTGKALCRQCAGTFCIKV